MSVFSVHLIFLCRLILDQTSEIVLIFIFIFINFLRSISKYASMRLRAWLRFTNLFYRLLAQLYMLYLTQMNNVIQILN